MAKMKICPGSLAVIIIILPEFKRTLRTYLELFMKMQIKPSNADLDYGALRIALKNPPAFKRMLQGAENKTESTTNEQFVEVDEIELEPIPVTDEGDGAQVDMDDDLSNPYRLFDTSSDGDFSMECLMFAQQPGNP